MVVDQKIDQNAMLLKLMSSLCLKIEDLGSGIEKGNATIIKALGMTTTTVRSKPSALRPSSYAASIADERTAATSTANYATSVREGDTQLEGGKEDTKDEQGKQEEEDDGWPCSDPDWGPYDPSRKSSKGQRKSSSRTRLYAIAKGRGVSRPLDCIGRVGMTSSFWFERNRSVGSRKCATRERD